MQKIPWLKMMNGLVLGAFLLSLSTTIASLQSTLFYAVIKHTLTHQWMCNKGNLGFSIFLSPLDNPLWFPS